MNQGKRKIKVKICGIRREADVSFVNACLPDYVGFVFAESARRVTAKEAARLKSLLDPRIQSVGVFVREAPENIVALCEAGIISSVQLHGDESEEEVAALKRRIPVPLIKAISLSRDAVRDTVADFLLLDSARAGSGTLFNWDLIGQIPRPFFLAGGLTPDNAAEAAGKVRPYALDVSSGVETGGVKDLRKIQDFLEAVRPWRE
ncbi:MAG: phosphoribosylanthranilate isomerase [Clostridiales Family XIII bacterium]|jgi:phosphoribosylanthranilate isomerase|nr:phosphoribosylanthranilate isomerase [Clostridiales Family XIII bacterium]